MGWELERDIVDGYATPGATVVLHFQMTTISVGPVGTHTGHINTSAGADGRWSVDLFAQRKTHLAPGARLQAWELLPSGHRVGLQRMVPEIGGGVGGGSVAVRGDPLAATEIALADASGTVVARTDG